MYKLHSLQHPDWHRTGTSYCYFYIIEIIHHDIVIFSKTYPSFLTIKEGSTFLAKPLFNGLYTPFGSPVPGGQKPQEREDVTALSAISAPPVPPQREGPYPIPKP